jgi:predicted ATPase
MNLSARLMTAADFGQSMVSAFTAERAEAGFKLKKLKPIKVKGKSAPIQIRLLQDVRNVELTTKSIDAPFVGREAELKQLKGLISKANRGKTQWVHISGEAGIGKSRLCREYGNSLRESGWSCMNVQCPIHLEHSPLSVWQFPLRKLFGLEMTEEDLSAWEKVNALVEKSSPLMTDYAPLLADLLNIPAVENPVTHAMDGKTRRKLRTELVVDLAGSFSSSIPLFLLFEDVHYMDAPSAELVAALVANGNGSIIVCTTSRSMRFENVLSQADRQLDIQLGELDRESVQKLLASDPDLGPEQREILVSRAHGNPLFLLELARSGKITGEELPESVHDVVMIRLDGLGDEQKRLLRSASVIGQVFETNTLKALLPDGEITRREIFQIKSLIESGFLRSFGGQGSFEFGNGITWEVAYDTVPYAERRFKHKQIGEHLESSHPGRISQMADVLLHHFESAANAKKSVKYAALSGDRAASIFANDEAIAFYKRALDSLNKLADKPEDQDRALISRLENILEASGGRKDAETKYKEAETKAALLGDQTTGQYRHQQATDHYHHSLKMLMKVSRSTAADRSYLQERIGDVYGNSAREKEAQIVFEEAIGLWLVAKNTRIKSLLPWKVNKRARESLL